MAKADRNRFTRVYHTLVALLMLLAGGALLGLGLWLSLTDNGNPFDLNYSGEGALNVILRTNVASLILGAILLLTGVISLIALSKNCIGVTFRIIYIVIAICIFTLLVAITIVSVVLLRNSDGDIRNVMRDAWKETVTEEPKIVCSIERLFECRGFENNDCTGCTTGLEPSCSTVTSLCAICKSPSKANPSVGCFAKIRSRLRNIFLPISIVSGILAGVVLLDIFFSCCL